MVTYTASAEATGKLVNGVEVTASGTATSSVSTDDAEKLAKDVANSALETTIDTIEQTIKVLGYYYSWTIKNAAAINPWQSVCYGNGLFVAVSNTGTIDDKVMTSPDGINWTSRKAGENNLWQSVCYGNGLFVAVASDGTNRVMTSPDGINWTRRISGTDTSCQWKSVCYGNGKFVAVSSASNQPTSNRILYSYNGINWVNTNVPNSNSWQSVCYGNGKFVAVADGNINFPIIYSNDGIVWFAGDSSLTITGILFKSVCYANGYFVAVSSAPSNTINTFPVLVSSDGITWTNSGINYGNTSIKYNFWESVCYGNGFFISVSSGDNDTTSTSNNRVMASQDGLSWASVTTSDIDKKWTEVCYGNEMFVAVATDASVMISGRQNVNEENSIQPFLATGDGNIVTYPGFKGSLDSSLVIGGTLNVTSTTDSDSTTTGALVVSGGVGIAKKLYVDGVASLNSLIVTSTNARNTINSTNGSTSSTTGALVVSGGVGIGQNLHVGGAFYAKKNISSGNAETNSSGKCSVTFSVQMSGAPSICANAMLNSGNSDMVTITINNANSTGFKVTAYYKDGRGGESGGGPWKGDFYWIAVVM
jgi:hypothetical protein